MRARRRGITGWLKCTGRLGIRGVFASRYTGISGFGDGAGKVFVLKLSINRGDF